MALPVIANVFRVTFNWVRTGGQHAVNVLNFSAPGKDSDDVMQALNDNVTSIMWALNVDSSHIATVDILPLDGSTSTTEYIPTTAGNWDGAVGGSPVPAIAAVVKLATGLRGPRHRGRLFLPFISESAVDSGFVTSSDLGACRTGWVTFANDMATDGVALGVASYAHADWNQAVNINIEDALATQKRRQDRLRV